MDYIHGRMDIGEKYGVDVCIFVDCLYYWTEKNVSISENFKDGRYWVYHTLEGFAKMYPIWSRDQVKRIVAKCKDAGLIVTADYNETSFQHTKWYALTETALLYYGVEVTPEGNWLVQAREELDVGRNRHIDMAIDEGRNRHTDMAEAPNVIQGSNIINTPVKEEKQEKENKKKKKTAPKELDEDTKTLLREYVGDDDELRAKLADMIISRRDGGAVNSHRAIKALLNLLDKYSGGDREVKLELLDRALSRGWLTVYPLRSWEVDGNASGFHWAPDPEVMC